MHGMDNYETDNDSEYEDEFGSAIREAFPEKNWDEDQLEALKEAIRLCMEKDEGMGMMGKKKPGTLALIFGGKPKKE